MHRICNVLIIYHLQKTCHCHHGVDAFKAAVTVEYPDDAVNASITAKIKNIVEGAIIVSNDVQSLAKSKLHIWTKDDVLISGNFQFYLTFSHALIAAI